MFLNYGKEIIEELEKLKEFNEEILVRIETLEKQMYKLLIRGSNFCKTNKYYNDDNLKKF